MEIRMIKRKSIEGPGIPVHVNPIPAASLVGNVLFSSLILGKDPDTGELPPDADVQIRNAFRLVRTIVEQAGGSVDDIGKMDIVLRDRETRSMVNPYWLEMFPDETSRPARHTASGDLRPGVEIEIEFFAVL
jgi:enamine deaminase RidA (YjgF/YER057c/UK114 family)